MRRQTAAPIRFLRTNRSRPERTVEVTAGAAWRATSSIAADGSSPTTRPSGTATAISTVRRPVPQPRSSTRSPGAGARRAMTRRPHSSCGFETRSYRAASQSVTDSVYSPKTISRRPKHDVPHGRSSRRPALQGGRVRVDDGLVSVAPGLKAGPTAIAARGVPCGCSIQ